MAATLKHTPAVKTVLIVDDHPMLRLGLATLLEHEPDLSVCGQAASAQDALAEIKAKRPNLVTVDLKLAGGSDGLTLIKEIKTQWPEIPILAISMFDEISYAERALKAGAWGYLTKTQLDDTIIVAVRRVLDGKTYMSDALKSQLATRFLAGETRDSGDRLNTLSDREMQVFEQIGRGRNSRQIARTMKLSVKTIESHLEHIKRKLKVASGTMLARRATQWVENDK